MKKVLIIMVGLLLIGANAFAQGNLIVNGKLGIGTATPALTFHLLGPNGQFYSDGQALNLQRSSDTVGAFIFEIFKSRGGVGSETNVNSNDFIGQYDMYYRYNGDVLGARWGAAMDNSTSQTKFFFAAANRTQFQMNVDIDGGLKLNNGSATCIMMRDTDDAGWTECNSLDGQLICSIDADGVCDGQ